MNSIKETILIIDDNIQSIKEIFEHLQEAGYETIIEDNGYSGLKRAISLKPSLIMLDIMMPEMDGFQTCTQLKQNNLTKDIPIIFLTAYNSPSETIKAFKSGGVDYITKTAYREEILARVHTHLKIRHQTIELERAMKAAEEANHAKSIFIANVSHEIRTPMNAILGFSEILFSKAKDSQEKHYLKTIHYSAQTLLTLINDILDLSKVEAGKIDLQNEPICFHELIHDIQELFERQIHEKGISLITEVNPDIPEWILIDPLRIRQVLINLVGNAVKFTERGHIRISVSGFFLDDLKSKCRLQIDIADTGIGIPKNQHHLVFEYFHQQIGQNENKYGGTGLGLRIAKRLVEIMKGTISMTSEVNKGTTFTIFFPELPTQLCPETSETYENELMIEFKPSAIMIVDAVETNRELIKGYLEQSPIRFIEAETPAAAFNLLSELNRKISEPSTEIDPPIIPDLILADIRITDNKNAETLKKINYYFESFKIPMVAITASAMKDEMEILKNTFNGYLIKPISRRDLFQTLKKFLPCSVTIPTIQSSEYQENQRETLEDISYVIDILEKDIIPKWKEINTIFFVDEIAEFSKQIQIIARDYHMKTLFDYSMNLSEFVRANKITEIEALLSEFPYVVDQIKTRYLDLIR